jgi:hypothetical protein
MTTAPVQPSLDLTVSVADLTSLSQFKKLIQGDATPIFRFGAGIAPYWDFPVQTVPNGTSVSVTVTGSGSWKTNGTGIGFDLSGSTKCQLKVVSSGAAMTYAPDLQSSATSQLPENAYPGRVFVVISLDFQISGNVSGSGNIGALGIGGNVKGSEDTSVVFCHLVAGSRSLRDAVKETFEKFVFPFEPTCASDMNSGDIAQINFNGSLGCGLDVSYGVTNVKFSAPGVASTIDSITKGAAQLTLPSGKIDIGAKASVGYTHSDDFTAIVEKQDSNDAFLYIMRGHKNDVREGLSVAATVTITNTPGVNVDPQVLQRGVNNIVGTGGQQAAEYATEIADGLTNKLNGWINDTVSKGASLAAEWDQHSALSMLFKYEIELADSGKLISTWKALCTGNLRGAVSCGGLVPEPGSGISHQLSRSFTMSLQLFNLFSASDVSTYFQKTSVTVTENGGLRYLFDIGKESDVTVRKSKKTCIIHFVGSVDETTAKAFTAADVDLEMELTSTNNQKEAGRIGDLIGYIPPNQQVNLAQKSMQKFVDSNPSGTLKLVCTLKPSAYGRLSCSEYLGNKPPANQQQDSENWLAFEKASVGLLKLAWANTLTYDDWERFNVLCVHGPSVPATPDRRSVGNQAKVPSNFWSNINAPVSLIGYFLLNSAEFMNLCDDLHQLAGLSSTPNNPEQDKTDYDSLLLSMVELIVTRDVNNDYSKPAFGALLRLSNPQNVAFMSTSGKNTFTCTLTLT